MKTLSPPLLLGIARRRGVARQSRVARCRKAEARAVTLPTLAVGRTVVAPPLAVHCRADPGSPKATQRRALARRRERPGLPAFLRAPGGGPAFGPVFAFSIHRY